MNTHKYIVSCVTTVLIVIFCITGCNNNSQGTSGSRNDIRFDSIQVETEYHLLEKNENPHCELKLNFIYPDKFASSEILKAIRNDFVVSFFNEHFDGLSPQEAIDKFTEEYIKEYKSLEEYFQDDIKIDSDAPVEAWYNFYEIRYNEIFYNQSNILSYCSYKESFTGGAHGSHVLRDRVLDLTTGLPINESDIFIEDYQEKLAAIILKYITKENDLSDPKELEDIGYFSIDEIYPNNNFVVNESGITYDFNEYEIAAYVVGITSIHIPYDEIRHLLRTNSPISHLAGN